MFVHPGASATARPYAEAVRRGLADLGWQDGRNVTFETRFGEGQLERLPEIFAELVRSRPSVIVAATTPGSLAAKKATSEIPIVLVAVGDPVAVGLVQSYARPGENVTGATNSQIELTGKRLQILKEALPGLARVAVLGNSNDQNFEIQKREADAAAQTLGLTLRFLDPIRAALVAPTMARLARTRLASMFGFRDEAEAGGLLSYGPDIAAHYRQAAVFVDKILRCARPADLPVERPTKFEFVVNLKTARALGLTIPPALLLRADHLIE